MNIRPYLLTALCLSLTGCNLIDDAMQSIRETVDSVRPEPVAEKKVSFDFAQLYADCNLANDAYLSDEKIRAKHPRFLTHIGQLPKYEVKYFILRDGNAKTITIAIRGTENIKDAVLDANARKNDSDTLNATIHSGFKKVAKGIFEEILPKLEPDKKDYKIKLTGHSMGGASAVILMMYLQKNGFTVSQVTTFGQPKVTTDEGAAVYANAPVLRIVHNNDIVPLLPPRTFFTDDKEQYEHLGPEIILLKDQYFAYMHDRRSEDPKLSSLWLNLSDENLKNHRIDRYLDELRPKLDSQQQVPYDERSKYSD